MPRRAFSTCVAWISTPEESSPVLSVKGVGKTSACATLISVVAPASRPTSTSAPPISASASGSPLITW
jgi:hypothetical protein